MFFNCLCDANIQMYVEIIQNDYITKSWKDITMQ